ncbi:transporter [Paraburkholderia sp. PGU19]|uniref:SphA family protein n=1 Tax=Paraburkholderia sp. PGU19 TaxID=2735434 RepID=UPI001FB14C98|nr:transporter [Paraburkholderia sp. PGU19]
MANLVKTWGVSLAGWNFASSIGVPVQYSNASSFNGLLRPDHGTQFADIFFAPVIAGYRLSPTDYTALSLQIYAPTGAYNPNRLANAGQNTWTFTPTIAYTKVFPKNNVELTVNYGVEFYTTNSDTNYHNAAVSVLDVLALKRFRSGWSVGVVGGWIQQLGNDTGPTADLIGGAKGYSVGMGPIVGWAGKIGKTPVSANLRWVNEFAAHARPSGNAVQFSLSATFE